MCVHKYISRFECFDCLVAILYSIPFGFARPSLFRLTNNAANPHHTNSNTTAFMPPSPFLNAVLTFMSTSAIGVPLFGQIIPAATRYPQRA
jgi:hypothetical protein